MAPKLWPNDELTCLANRYGSDKGTEANCAHGYTRVYHALFEPFRNEPLRIAEIGLMHGLTQQRSPEQIEEIGCPSLRMWAEYFPQAQVFGFDIVDFTRFSGDRVRIARGDQGRRSDLAEFGRLAGAPFDLIIDDGSHASHHQQITLTSLLPFLADGGLYIIEDLHYQPAELELPGIGKTRDFLARLRNQPSGVRLAMDQSDYALLLQSVADIQFFDSISPRWPLHQSADALAVIQKRGRHLRIPPLRP